MYGLPGQTFARRTGQGQEKDAMCEMVVLSHDPCNRHGMRRSQSQKRVLRPSALASLIKFQSNGVHLSALTSQRSGETQRCLRPTDSWEVVHETHHTFLIELKIGAQLLHQELSQDTLQIHMSHSLQAAASVTQIGSNGPVKEPIFSTRYRCTCSRLDMHTEKQLETVATHVTAWEMS